MSKTILTEEGFRKIQKEINHIKTIRIPDIEKRLEVAEQVGDEEAIKSINEELNFYTQRIPYLENMQATAKVVKPEFGTYAAHQPNYEGFAKLGVLDDYVFQSLAHMGNASHLMSWAFTVLDHTDVPKELREEVRQVVAAIPELQEKLRAYRK
ncbi:hypothetical protein ABEW24_23980 [Paenibacillus jamilae]|nr:hypothetical protein [Paenibacillus polymyxa]